MAASESNIPIEKMAYGRVFFWRGIILASLVAWGLVLYHVGGVVQARGFLAASLKWQLAAAAGLAAELLGLALLLASFTPLYTRVYTGLKSASGLLRRLGILNSLVFLACAGFFSSLVYGDKGYLVENLWARAGLIWTLALPAGASLWAMLPAAGEDWRERTYSWFACFLAALIGLAVVFKLVGFLPDMTSYPLSRGWSETSRYYYASLFFSERLYGLDLAWPFLHPSRYLLQSIPYLAWELPLQAHRVWQVVLWVGMTALTSAFLARRLRLGSNFWRWAVAGWAFLFLFQGPVYYHLLVCVIIILWGFQPRRLWLSLAVVAAASLWAGISRINWFPVPAFLAVMIYLLEVPFSEARGCWDYLRRPLLWLVTGGVSAFAAQAIYILVSGSQDARSFGSSFTSDLLWYRLWPSTTYPPGILPMTVLLSLPLLLAIAWYALRGGFHPVRQLGLAGMTLVLFAGGLVVSTKIGGGSNLHNLDAYLVLLMVWGSSLVFGRFTPEPGTAALRPAAIEQPAAVERPTPVDHPRAFALPWVVLLLIVVLPVYWLLQEGHMFEEIDITTGWDDTLELQGYVEEAAAQGGRVLFISQRHLQTFGMVRGVPLEPDYETVELMEMAMSGNSDYLNQFYTDLREHRFDLIVTGELNTVFKGPQDSFPEENNVWVRHVSFPVLRYYQSVLVLPHSRIQLLVPKQP